MKIICSSDRYKSCDSESDGYYLRVTDGEENMPDVSIPVNSSIEYSNDYVPFSRDPDEVITGSLSVTVVMNKESLASLVEDFVSFYHAHRDQLILSMVQVEHGNETTIVDSYVTDSDLKASLLGLFEKFEEGETHFECTIRERHSPSRLSVP